MEQVKASIKVILISAAVILYLPACATFFDFGTEAENTYGEERDRGFAAEETEMRQEESEAEEARPLQVVDRRERRVRDAINVRDVILGMSKTQVLSSWGEPITREIAGQNGDGHERWRYGSRYSLQGERVVIFENGRVAGWYR